MRDKDTICDHTPKRDHVVRRLAVIQSMNGSLALADQSLFDECIPVNPLLATKLWSAKDTMVELGEDISPELVVDGAIRRGLIQVK